MSSEFDRLESSLFKETCKRHPEFATSVGIHDYDDQLDDPSDDFLQSDIRNFGQWVDRFRCLDRPSLDADRCLDIDLLEHALARRRFEFDTLRLWERDPEGLEDVLSLCFLQLIREYDSIGRRLESIASRLERLPQYLDRFRARVKRPVGLWVRMALDTAREAPEFLSEIEGLAEREAPPALRNRIASAVRRALGAVADQTSWLKETAEKATGDFAIGPEALDALVEGRALDRSVEEIVDLGESSLAALRNLRAQIAKEIDPQAGFEEAWSRVRSSHATSFEAVLDRYREAAERARSFIRDRGLATIDEGNSLRIIETPTFLRSLCPFAAYFAPARFDTQPVGIYIVTRLADSREALREHNDMAVLNTTVHEGYPGHHLQLLMANRHASLVRHLTEGAADATEMVEGWAHYSEEMMLEQGFVASPAFRLAQTVDATWRAIRIMLDVKLARGEMGVEEAAALLRSETGMPEEGARLEVERYTKTPGYALSYLLGKRLLLDLREELRARSKDGFSEKRFHDAVLRAGSIPVSFIRRRLLEET